MGIHEQWEAEKASDWTVKPSAVKLEPIGSSRSVAKTFIDILNNPTELGTDEEIDLVVSTWTDTDGIYAEGVEKGNPYHDPTNGRFTTGPASGNPMIRTGPPPKNTKIAYKVFVAKDGKLYPPMVANPDGQDTPVGVWLNASEGKMATDKDGNPITNTLGRNKVQAGGKGTQGGSGTLAYRPGWHLGEVPEAKQFYTKDKATGEKLQKKNFVWAECEIAADFDYQDEAMSYGYNKNGKFQHSLAGLPKIPTDGYYTYRTNPDPTTKPWYITGAMKVNRILTDAETNQILRSHGIEPMKRDGGELDLAALGFTKTDFVGKSADQYINIFKTDEDKRLVFGWASIAITVDGEQLEDLQKDMIDPEDLEEAAYEYVLNFRDTGEEHVPAMRKRGKLVESCVLTAEKQKAMGIPEGTVPVGWWIGFKIHDDDAWNLVKSGHYRMFSIEGKANRVPFEKADRVAKSFDEIIEISKFNPYHDSRGRFSTADAATSFTYAPGKSKAHDNAIAREKERHQKQQEEQEKPRTITLNQQYKEMANNWSHMNDKGAYVEREANKQLDAFRDEFKNGDYTDEQKAYLKQRENEYADLLTEKYNDQLYREGTNPSAMMAGPAKFDHRKFERKFEAEMRSQEEYRNKQQKFIENTKKQLERMEPEDKQISRWRQGKWSHGETISADDPLAEKKLQAKLDYHTEQQQKMKDANAYYRKNGTMQGFTGFNDATNKKIDAQMQDFKDRGMEYYAKQPFQSYSLTNNNASIKSTKDRLTQLQNQKQRAAETGGNGGGTKFNGGELVRNTGINRLQIKFDSIPDAETRQKLKSAGWRWSPKEGAWQRQLTDNAERSASSILGITKSMNATVTKGDRDMNRYDLIEEVSVAKTFDEIIEINKFNPYHDARGRFASANSYASFTYAPGKSKAHDNAIARMKYGKETDTSDAAKEIRGGYKNSMADYLDENGKLTPEREAVHQKIIDDLLKGKTPVEGQATMTILGGGPASGKSSVLNPDTSGDPHSVTVDPDMMKALLPGYKEMAGKTTEAASFYHEESSALAKRFAEAAINRNLNVIYDGTGDGSVNSVQKKIDGARAGNYKIVGKYVTVDTETAVARNQKRYDDAKAAGKAPRLVPAEYVRNTHAKVTDISVAKAADFDVMEIWDNNGARGQQKLIATGGGGKGLVATDRAALQRYLDKGFNTYTISDTGEVK